MSGNKRVKKVLTFDEFLKEANEYALKQVGLDKKTQLEKKYARSLSDARAQKFVEVESIKKGKYSLRTKILKHKWLNNSPYNKALKWLFNEVFKDPNTYKYNKNLLQQGQLFIFEYKNPKYRGTSVLPWFDKYPLVISLGPVVTKLGLRNIGFNLHLLPPKIRIIVLCVVFDIYKRIYRQQIVMKNQQPVEIKYYEIIRRLEPFGVKFCVRMYIPGRMNQVCKFPYRDWHNAIFIPSRGYDGILAGKLIKEWKLYTKKHGISVSPNIDWKRNI